MAKKVKISDRLTVWNLVMLFLSIYVLISLFIETAFPLPSNIKTLLLNIDNIICIFFMSDFFYHFYTAKSKLGYLKWGWIDFVSGIPNIPFLWIGRFAQVFRIFRAIRSLKFILLVLFQNRAKGTLTTVSLMGFSIMVFSTIVILQVENVPESNIKDADDALWWAITTVTTVGYGDKFPVTHAGRAVGAFLMITGVGLLGAFMAYFASIFMKGDFKEEKRLEKKVLHEIKNLKKQIQKLENTIKDNHQGRL